MQLRKTSSAHGYPWEYVRQKGQLRYILEEGLAYWGGGVFTLQLLGYLFLYGRVSKEVLLVLAASSLFTGALFGLSAWYVLEALYARKVTKRKTVPRTSIKH